MGSGALSHGLMKVTLIVGTMAFCGWTRGDADDTPSSVEELKRRIDDGSERAREAAAVELGTSQYDPDVLVPWLRERLVDGTAGKPRLEIAFALAAQGEVEGLRILVESLQVRGHLGAVYLDRVTRDAVPTPPSAWDRPAWGAWLERLDPLGWREFQRLRHLPRVPLDADAAGLARAIDWWDGLTMPDVKTLPFVRVHWGDPEECAPEYREWDLGFLLSEGEAGARVFLTTLEEFLVTPAGLAGRTAGRVERVDVVDEVRSCLEPNRDDPELLRRLGGVARDPFGEGRYELRRFQGLVLARALVARGAPDLALRTWERIAKEPDDREAYGPWVTLELAKRDAEAWLLSRVARMPIDSETTWARSLEELRAWRARGVLVPSSLVLETDTILARMAVEESGYAAEATAADADPAVRAARWVRGLPRARRSYGVYDGMPSRSDPVIADGCDGLIALGIAAMPALLVALEDRRFTRATGSSLSRFGGHVSWVRRVQDVALEAVNCIAMREFGDPIRVHDRLWPEIRERVDVWWTAYRTKGKAAVLTDGVLARTGDSEAQARQLAARYPEQALDPIREAAAGSSDRGAAALVAALAVVATPAVQAFLRECVAEDRPVRVRMAAAEALHAQGLDEGVHSLLSAWPKIDGDCFEVEELAELLVRSIPVPALERMRATQAQASLRHRRAALGAVGAALGYETWQGRDGPASRPQPPAVWAAAEAFVLCLVLDDEDTGSIITLPDAVQMRRVGEQAADSAAYFWPEKYAIDLSAPPAERIRQRYALFNRWRGEQGLDPVSPPMPPAVAIVPSGEALRRIDAWLAAPDGTPRDVAGAALLDAGLGVLPSLDPVLAALPATDARREALSALRARIAALLREIRWAEEGPLPTAALRAQLMNRRGQPLTGWALMNICRQVTVETPEGVTGLQFTVTRETPITGYRVDLTLTTHTVPWVGGQGGWILTHPGGGRVLVHGARLDTDSYEARSVERICDERLAGGDEDFAFKGSIVKVR